MPGHAPSTLPPSPPVVITSHLPSAWRGPLGAQIPADPLQGRVPSVLLTKGANALVPGTVAGDVSSVRVRPEGAHCLRSSMKACCQVITTSHSADG